MEALGIVHGGSSSPQHEPLEAATAHSPSTTADISLSNDELRDLGDALVSILSASPLPQEKPSEAAAQPGDETPSGAQSGDSLPGDQPCSPAAIQEKSPTSSDSEAEESSAGKQKTIKLPQSKKRKILTKYA